MKKLIIGGCLIGASFFVACQQQTTTSEAPATSEEKSAVKEYDLKQESELSMLMQKMYEDNLELKAQIEEGIIPESFPEDFYHIHDAVATKGMLKDRTIFDGMAKSYMQSMENITKASDTRQAKLAYNQMVQSCASCHSVYCQGPLPKIHKMRIKLDE